MAVSWKVKKRIDVAKLPDRISSGQAKDMFTAGRGHKYGSRTTCKHGMAFDSKREADRYTELLLQQKAGMIERIRTQVPYILIPKSRHGPRIVYIADFVYTDLATGAEVVEDAKGVKTEGYRLKKRLLAERYGIVIKEV